MTVNPVGKKTLDAKRRKQQQQQQERRPPFLFFFSLFLCPLARDCRFTYVNQPVKRLNVFTPSLVCLSYHRPTSTYSPDDWQSNLVAHGTVRYYQTEKDTIPPCESEPTVVPCLVFPPSIFFSDGARLFPSSAQWTLYCDYFVSAAREWVRGDRIDTNIDVSSRSRPEAKSHLCILLYEYFQLLFKFPLILRFFTPSIPFAPL